MTPHSPLTIKDGRTPEKWKRKLFSGVFFLTVSNLLAKLCGLFLKVPLTNLLGGSGMAYFNLAYAVYRWFYLISTAGLPVAAAVLTSDAYAHPEKGISVYRIRNLSLLLFSLTGACGSLLMYGGAEVFAALQNAPEAAFAIRAAAPALFLICCASALRGWYQGLGTLLPTAVSQTAEAAVKLIGGLWLASGALAAGKRIPHAAASAIAGLTAGCFAGLAVMLAALPFLCRRLRREGMRRERNRTQAGTPLAGKLIRIAVPVTLSASVLSLTDMLDSMIVIRRLCAGGMAHGEALRLYGCYTSLAVPMFHLPAMLLYPVTSALLPLLAGAEPSRRRTLVREAFSLTACLSLPCAAGLSVLAEPILRLFFQPALAETAAPFLRILAPAVFFLAVLTVCSAVLQATGHPAAPFGAMLAGGAVKLAASWILTAKPEIGMTGAPVSTLLCYAVMACSSLVCVMRAVQTSFPAWSLFGKPALCSVFCALSARAAVFLCPAVIGEKPAVLLAVLTGAAVYAASLLLTGGFSPAMLSFFGKSRGKTERHTAKRA